MRYPIPLITAFSGLAITTAWVAPDLQGASAAQIKPNTRVAVASPAIEKSADAPTKTICSRNRPLALNASADPKTATLPQHLSFASNIVELFCRDVRINTIVVRDYCAVIRG